MDFFEVFISDVSIYLGGGDRGVPEHGLNASNIRSIGKEIGCKGVSECMWVNVFYYASFGGIVFYNTLNTSRRQALVIACTGGRMREILI